MHADPEGQRSNGGSDSAPRSRSNQPKLLRTPHFTQDTLPDEAAVAPAIREALRAPRASIAARFLYDELGSSLFEAITALPEYYPTRTEAGIVARDGEQIAAAVDLAGGTLIDLGAGSCEKGSTLLRLLHPSQYVPVDISVEFLRTAVNRLQLENPEVEMIGVGTDFSSRLHLPQSVHAGRRLFFYPGSSIGNFSRQGAVEFLSRVRAQMGDDGALWIGVDLVKDHDVLVRAYDDELGVTAAFNRNTLRNVNRLAGTDFSPRDWRHVARFDEPESRIEMHLEAREPTRVTWPDGERSFAAGERIHTENSHKYTVDGFRDLLGSAGLQAIGHWTDARQWFAIFVARPADR